MRASRPGEATSTTRGDQREHPDLLTAWLSSDATSDQADRACRRSGRAPTPAHQVPAGERGIGFGESWIEPTRPWSSKSIRTGAIVPHDSVYILGLGSTVVGRQPERGFTDLARESIQRACDDAGIDDPDVFDQVWFSNYMMDFWGQRACRGQEVLTPIVQEGLLPAGIPILNVEAGCASGSVAFHEAWKHVLSGQSDVALAVGVEKMTDPSRPTAEALDWIGAAAGALDPIAYWKPFEISPPNSERRSTSAPGPSRSTATHCGRRSTWTPMARRSSRSRRLRRRTTPMRSTTRARSTASR